MKVPTDPMEIETLSNKLYYLCVNCNMGECRVTTLDVRKATSKLKRGKSDGIDGFIMSYHIIHASDKFCVIVGMLRNAMLTHDHNPSQLLNIVVKSIPKDMRGSLHSSNNYRGISLCNALCKLIDIILIEKCDGYLYTSELQFAYKRDHSTMLCTAVFKETVSHFLENGSNVYACLLDAPSAFDRVHYGKLFDVLIKRNMPAVFIRLFLDRYLNQRICAAWGACKSDFSQATNGIKQDSIISPILFTVYVDELIARLQASGLGCNIGRSYIGVLGYADDLTLLSPSVNALSKMVGICEEYVKEYDIVFNCKKTVGIQFGSRCNNCVINLNGNEIKWQRSVKHLGNILDQKLLDMEDCRFKKSFLLEMLINTLGITVHLRIAASANCFSRIVHRFMVQNCGL